MPRDKEPNICESCEGYILRAISKRLGRTTNCLAYGCTTFMQTGRSCHRDDLVRYCLDVIGSGTE